MYGGSWELTSRRNVKSLRRGVLSAVPGVPKAAPHQRWRSTTISFGASDCPKNMARAGILPLITAPIIANMRLHHVLIDGGAGRNVISHAAFKQLQIPGSRLGPSRPFSGVGPQPVYPLGSIALPITFRTEENFRTENVQFDAAEVNLPFNAIIGRPTLYQFMAISHYGVGRPCRCTSGGRDGQAKSWLVRQRERRAEEHEGKGTQRSTKEKRRSRLEENAKG
jgi:hypothetical protein